MKLVNQTNFSYGEVNEELLQATDQPEYLRALSKCKNVYITSQRTAKKRAGFQYLYESSLVTDNITRGTKDISFSNGKNQWVTAVFYLSDNNSQLKVYLRRWPSVGEHVLSANVVGVTSIDDFSIDSSDDFIVATNVDNQTLEVKVDFDNIANSTISTVKFSVVPSVDDGSIDYSSWLFTLKNTPTGIPLGQLIEISNLGGSSGFPSNYVGGMLISENGTSVESPLATALIETVAPPSGGKQEITTVVMTPFSADAKETHGAAWSVRAPVWGAGRGWPRLCSFHGGRLYLTGTKKFTSLIAGSRLNTYNDFNVKGASDVDAIVYLMQEPKGGPIEHMFGGVNLNLWTKEVQYIAWSGLDVGLTPKNFFPRSVSNYSISKNDPLRYKNMTYFVTSDGKNVIQMSEDYQSAKVQDISFSAAHLINNPTKMEVNVLPNLEEQIMFFKNEDDTTFMYSNAPMTGVSAFSPADIKIPTGYKLITFENIENEMYLIMFNNSTKKLIISKAIDSVYLDNFSGVTISNKTATVQNIYSQNDKISLIKRENGVTTWYGQFTVGASNVINADVPDGNYEVGYLYDAEITTMNNISSPENIFYKNKRYQKYVGYNKSYDFDVDGKTVATSTISEIQDNPKLQTGFVRLGDTSGNMNDNRIRIYQNAPYPLVVQNIGYIVEGALIA